MRNKVRWWLPGVMLGLAFAGCGLSQAEPMRLYGALVAEPCTLVADDESITLEFGTIVEKYLYLNQRTLGKNFQLRLTGCDVQTGSSVMLRFSGPASSSLPGLLALDATSQAGGLAIGIETPEGRALPFNKYGEPYPLTQGDNVLQLRAYVQGEPEALSQQKIRRGEFSAVATLSLMYP